MRVSFLALLFVGLAIAVAGCGPRKPVEGPTVDAFRGKVTHQGKPVTFPEGSNPTLKLFHESGRSFDIRLQPDGSFKIGWMPIGKHSATLLRANKKGIGPPETRFNIPGGVTIEAGKTEYEIDLGSGWIP
jgi:hypothetical protein